MGARDQKCKGERVWVCERERERKRESRTPLNCGWVEGGFDFHGESANKCQPARWGYGGPMGIKCRGRVEDHAVQVPPRGDDSERFRDVRRGSCFLFSAPFDSDSPVL